MSRRTQFAQRGLPSLHYGITSASLSLKKFEPFFQLVQDVIGTEGHNQCLPCSSEVTMKQSG